jgi:hypothetical protein
VPRTQRGKTVIVRTVLCGAFFNYMQNTLAMTFGCGGNVALHPGRTNNDMPHNCIAKLRQGEIMWQRWQGQTLLRLSKSSRTREAACSVRCNGACRTRGEEREVRPAAAARATNLLSIRVAVATPAGCWRCPTKIPDVRLCPWHNSALSLNRAKLLVNCMYYILNCYIKNRIDRTTSTG